MVRRGESTCRSRSWPTASRTDDSANCCELSRDELLATSMSFVAPVRAVLAMMCTASLVTSAGPTTRPIGSVSRSCLRRSSSCSPSSDADHQHRMLCGRARRPSSKSISASGAYGEQDRTGDRQHPAPDRARPRGHVRGEDEGRRRCSPTAPCSKAVTPAVSSEHGPPVGLEPAARYVEGASGCCSLRPPLAKTARRAMVRTQLLRSCCGSSLRGRLPYHACAYPTSVSRLGLAPMGPGPRRCEGRRPGVVNGLGQGRGFSHGFVADEGPH